MPQPNRCPNCGAEPPADLIEGLCPHCQKPMSSIVESSGESTLSPQAGPRADLDGEESEVTRAHTPRPAPAEATGEWSDVPSGPTRASSNPVAAPPVMLAPGKRVHYFGDYELQRELGRGGMGVVFEARQVSLNRPVALKLIKAGLLADGDELRRFQNEAEAVALLDHPGIVSAYEVGEYEGQQYLAMKLVRGESLSSLLERYHDDPRAAASLVAEAAEAVAHAHSRGILHRDLKPANILVDAEGHPHVTDFGLAKRLEADLEMTASGAILGTPAYMAPEQATGRRGGITTATDVYGLGSVLYALLTGRAPFGGNTVVETLDALRTLPPEPPIQLNADVPRDLETICLKCLEKDPRRRYASAQALADDLHAWLDSRPITARRVGIAERAWLWCKRRPSVAALAAAVALALVGGTAATITVQANANRALRSKNDELTLAYGREAKANAELGAANAQVEQRYNLAMDAIKTFHTGVSEDFLLKEPKFQSLRDRLLNAAGAFYQKLGSVLETGKDVASRRALLSSNFELAELEMKLARHKEALALHRRVLSAREALASEPGADPQVRVDVARSMRALLSLLKQTGPKDEIPPLLARSVATVERLVAERPDDPDAQGALATILNVQGDQLKNVDHKRDEAEKVIRRSLAVAEKLSRSHPENPKYLDVYSEALSCLCYLRADEGKYDEAIKLYQQVLDLAQARLDKNPKDVKLRSNLADCQSVMGSWYKAAVRLKEAIAMERELVKTRQQLVAEQPAVSGHRRNLASGRYGLGLALVQSGLPAEAEPEMREALAILTKLLEENPDLRPLRTSITDYHASLGYVLLELRRPADAETEYRAALAFQMKLLEDDPTDSELRDSLALSQFNLGRVLQVLGKFKEAEAAYGDAIATLEKLVAEQPSIAVFRARLAMVHRLLAGMYWKTGKPADAEAQFILARTQSKALVESSSNAAAYRNSHATDHNNLGDVLFSAGRITEARDCYEQATAIREQLVTESPETPLFRNHLAWSLRRRGLARSALGDLAGAAADTRRAIALWDGLARRVGDEWIETACAHAALSSLAGRAGSGISAEAAVTEAEIAMRLLRTGIQSGFTDAFILRTDPALDILRERPDFQLLMMDLAMPAEPFATRP